MLNAEGRFMAGLNMQNIHQFVNFGPGLNPGSTTGVIGSPTLAPLVTGASTSTYDADPREWSPGAELRLEARYQFCRFFSFHAGWTGIWLDGIARGDSTIDYTLHSNGQIFGIDLSRNRESVFMNGLTMGFDFNR